MKELFRIETNLFSLVWERRAKQDPPILAERTSVTGRLILSKRSPQLQFLVSNWRSGVPARLESEPSLEIGPPIYEQSDYQIYLKSRGAIGKIRLQHRDPNILQGLSYRENEQVLHGTINFRNQIGRSHFTVCVDGQAVLDFEVEVFPTKIDYQTDYQEILAQVQNIATGLAYEFLRSTHQLGKIDTSHAPSRGEWLIILEHFIGDLENSIHYIARQPRRSLMRQSQTNRIEKIRRVDSSIRSQVRRGAGRGALKPTPMGPMREELSSSTSIPTLDSMEHRWIKLRLIEIRRMLSQLSKPENEAIETTERKKAIRSTLRQMEQRISQLLRCEPLAAADGPVPNNFASLQLVSAPGYQQAFRYCQLLKFGLKLEGDLFRISVKDINVLYEYWVFLTIVEILRKSAEKGIQLRDLFKLNQKNLHLRLQEGRQQKVDCHLSNQRKISVIYNCQFNDKATSLIPQKPDIVIRYQETGWPETMLLCDAKYRIDASPEYRQQFGSFGPPPDAINVLHRYRDAILGQGTDITTSPMGNRNSGIETSKQLQHVVIQAVAVFPYLETVVGTYRQSKLWQSISRIGIGAIPALPGDLTYLRKWLVQAFQDGGWAMAERSIPHVAQRRIAEWKQAEGEPVLVGTLRGRNPQQHFDWIQSTRSYYVRYSKTQPRQLQIKQVAFYLPQKIDGTSAVTHVADVQAISVVRRDEIATPWATNFQSDQQMVLYRLAKIRALPQAIKYHHADKTSIQSPRYTTRLGLHRARLLSEIALETEAEWRLLEMLTAANISFTIEATTAKQLDPQNPTGRALFRITPHLWTRFDGMNGYLIKHRTTSSYTATPEQTLNSIKNLIQI